MTLSIATYYLGYEQLDICVQIHLSYGSFFNYVPYFNYSQNNQ